MKDIGKIVAGIVVGYYIIQVIGLAMIIYLL